MNEHKRLETIERRVIEPPPIYTGKQKTYRPPRKVQRPAPVTILFVMVSLTPLCQGIMFCSGFFLYGTMFSTLGMLLGVNALPLGRALAVAYGLSFIFWPLVAYGVFRFLCWLFDAWTGYKTAVIHEGTARALAELD